MKVKIVDNSHYRSETCKNGGDYSFTTIYTLRPDSKFDVTFSTSSEFQYCHLCGTFYHGDSCPCGMEGPDVVSLEQVQKEVDIANIRRYHNGENIEVRWED